MNHPVRHTFASFIIGALIALAFVGAARADNVVMSENDQTEYIVNLQAGITQLIERVARLENAQCTEDMPCWNCATMGNHVCGHKFVCRVENKNELNCDRFVFLHRAYRACDTKRAHRVYGNYFLDCMIDYAQMKGWVR